VDRRRICDRRSGERNLITQGSAELVHALLANDLVDAMSVFTIRVGLGAGKKLFADGSAPHSYKLTRSRVSSRGLTVAHYEREAKSRSATLRSIHRATLNARPGSG
jgi:dihydrofolate reductase